MHMHAVLEDLHNRGDLCAAQPATPPRKGTRPRRCACVRRPSERRAALTCPAARARGHRRYSGYGGAHRETGEAREVWLVPRR
jgi:hypothetical protein